MYLCISPGKISYSAAIWVTLKLALPMPESRDLFIGMEAGQQGLFPSRFNIVLNKLEYIFIYVFST